MELPTSPVPNDETQPILALHIPETDQPAIDIVSVEQLSVTPLTSQESGNIIPGANSDPKVVSTGLTEFHKYNNLPLELRIRVMEVNMFQDKTVTDPRIIKIHMEWNPEEEECFGDHGQAPEQPWGENSNEDEDEAEDQDGDDDDDDDDDDQESDEDDSRHMHVYPDHDNFAWKIEDDTEIRRSHRPLIPYFTVSKECSTIVENFMRCQMGRRYRAFWSPELRNMPLNPRGDIFYVDCELAWEAVNEWSCRLLRATHDALLMRKFMVDFPIFHGLVEPAVREKNTFLLYISNVDAVDYFRGESSMRAVFKNAGCISVIATAHKNAVIKYQDITLRGEEHGLNDDIPGLLTEEKEVMQSLWTRKNQEFNGLRHGNGYVPHVHWVTVAEKEGEVSEVVDQEADQENGQ